VFEAGFEECLAVRLIRQPVVERAVSLGGGGTCLSRLVFDFQDVFAVLVVKVALAGFFLACGFVGAVAVGKVLTEAAGADPDGFFLGFDLDGTGGFVTDETGHGGTPVGIKG